MGVSLITGFCIIKHINQWRSNEINATGFALLRMFVNTVRRLHITRGSDMSGLGKLST